MYFMQGILAECGAGYSAGLLGQGSLILISSNIYYLSQGYYTTLHQIITHLSYPFILNSLYLESLMRRSPETIPQETQLFLITKLNKVQQQLNKLSSLVSSDQQLNNHFIKKFLQEKSLSSDSSERGSTQNINKLLTNIDQQAESMIQYNSEVYQDNDTFSETISKLSIIKREENDTTSNMKLDGEGFVSTLSQGTKQNIRTQQNNMQHKLNPIMGIKDTRETKPSKPVISEIKMKPKIVSSAKNQKYLNSGNRSKGNLSSKKSKEIISPFLSKRKSTKANPVNQFKQESHHFQNRGKQGEPNVYPLLSPKLNKINGNRFRENLKKTIEIQNEQEGLHAKFHLNLSEQKPLMHRVIERNSFQKVYQQNTRKYEMCVKSLTESVIMSQLDIDFRAKSESLKLIMVFLSQFSQTIRKFFNDKPQEIELKFTQLIKQTISMLVKLPQKLYRNNYVSYVRYESLINSKIGIHKPASKLEQTVKVLREYMVFLSRNGLIEMTERANPHSDRKIIDYYSHRSKKDKVRTKVNEDIQDKVSNKYDTDRHCTGNNNTSRPVLQVPKKVKSPQIPKPKVFKIEKKEGKGKVAGSTNISKVKSEEALKVGLRKNPSMDCLRRRL